MFWPCNDFMFLVTYCRHWQALLSSVTSSCIAHLSNVSGSNSETRDVCLVHALPHMSQSDHTTIKVIATVLEIQRHVFSFPHIFAPPFTQSHQALLCDVTGRHPSSLHTACQWTRRQSSIVTCNTPHPADSSNYNGHSTVAETLFMGLPCVTQPGW